MGNTRSMATNRYDDNIGGVPWSDLNHDVLLLVIMRLEVIDFIAFSGVCKSWRSLALCNRRRFMTSKPPMYMWISSEDNKKDYCNLKDFEGRKYEILLPYYASKRMCHGITCGYLILFGREPQDFWLVNPITRHQLHFPGFPNDPGVTLPFNLRPRATLVFSPSISGWLFVMTMSFSDKIWFSISGKGVWNHVSTYSYILDLHAFKGKIYAINTDCFRGEVITHFCEMRLGPEPKLKVLETKNFPNIDFSPRFLSDDENLYVVDYKYTYWYKAYKLDFDKMKWVFYTYNKTKEAFAFYQNHKRHLTVAKQESWAGIYKSEKYSANVADFCYFPHECLNVNIMDE